MTWFTIELERPYASQSYQPGWTADAPPRWKREVGAWLNQRLDELERRVRDERIHRLPPDAGQRLADALAAAMPAFLMKEKAMRAVKPKATFNDLVRSEERQSAGWEGGVGRPGTDTDPNTATAHAARDLWRIRHVILPRFWSKAAKPTNAELTAIVAARHNGVSASAALNWYKNERLPSL